MKKIFFIALVALFSTSLYAQSATDDLKSGTNAVELQFTPFNTTNGSTFSLNNLGFSYRYFLDAKNVIRVNLNASFNTNKSGEKVTATETDQLGWIGTKDSWVKENTSSLTVAVGYERHFDISNRVAMYAGAGLGYIGSFSNTKAWINDDYTASAVKYVNTGDIKTVDPAAHYLLVAAVAGADFYIYKGLYLGMELGIRYMYGFSSSAESVSNGETSVTVTTQDVSTTTATTYENNKTTVTTTINGVSGTPVVAYTPQTTSHTSYASFNFYVNPALRIGWRF